MGSTVKPAFTGRDISNIADPDLIGGICPEVLPQYVFCNRQFVFRICSGLKFLYLLAAYAEFLSYLSYPADTDLYAVFCEIALNGVLYVTGCSPQIV